MPPRKLHLGKDAVVSVPIRLLHSKKVVSQTWPNCNAGTRIDNLVVVRQQVIKISRKDQVAVVLTYDKLPGKELHCVRRYARVITEGPTDFFFESNADSTGPETAPTASVQEQSELPTGLINPYQLRVEDPVA